MSARSSPRFARHLVWLPFALTLSACGDGPLPPASSDTDDGGQTTGEPVDPATLLLSASCLGAPQLSAGRWKADFAGPVGSLGTLCGAQGPELFGLVSMAIRADLVARTGGQADPMRLALSPPLCVDNDLPDLCEVGGGDLELRDLSPGTQVLARVGSDLGSEGWLEIELRAVLSEGDVCEPASRGRCESTTTCEQDLLRGGTKICRPVEGDSCARPLNAALDFETAATEGALELAVDLALGDNHTHDCIGAAVELVVRVELVGGDLLADDARLDLTLNSQGPVTGLGLAARGPGCATLEEIACSAAQGGAATIQIDDVGLRARRGEPLYVFVEFAGGPLPQSLRTIELLWSLVDSP